MAEEDIKVESPDEANKKEKASKKITKRDWDKVERYLKDELQQRKDSPSRTDHERIWREVDRQVQMQPMTKMNRDGSEVDMSWHNVVELGELSKSSENISADVRRILFPPSRFWFEAHSDLTDQFPFDPKTGERQQDTELQAKEDGRLRSFMVQQHEDFGLKDRVELCVKEALHHGSFVGEVDWEEQEMIFEATKVKTRGSAVLIPHSMWNCYPDRSPSVLGTQMFYTGSMFIESYMPRYKCEKLIKSGLDGWMASQWKKVPKDEHKVKDEVLKDVKITTYWGDLVIERGNDEDDLYFPNHKAKLFNGKLVYMAPNETPYPPLIYRGYERMDVRDPYYISPIIKQSPMQKLASQLANKTMDGIELAIEPPIVYDGNDPDFVLNGGPVIAPGSKVSTKGSNAFQQMQVGDVTAALQGLQLCLNEMKEKLGRPGKPVGDRATKAEVVKASQDQEVSLVDFISKMETALRSYLYMQHAMNLQSLGIYTYYSPEADDPDFLVMTKKDLPKAVHFEVVGARGVLGEEERNQKMKVTTAFLAGSPLFANLLDAHAIALEMYSDDGVKNPEHLMKDTNKADPAQLMAQMQQMQQMIQKIGQELQQEKQKSAVKIQKIQADHQAKMTKITTDHADREKKMMLDHQVKQQKIQTDAQHDAHKLASDIKSEVAHLKKEITMEMLHFMAGRHDKVQEGAQQTVYESIANDAKTSIDEMKDSVKEINAKVKDLEKMVTEPKKKTVKARKVNGVWQAEITH